MLSEEDRAIAQEFLRQLQQILAVRDLRVFGSRARGDAQEDSDLDIFVEVETLTPSLRQRIRDLAWEIGFARGRLISTIVATSAQLQHGVMGATPLIRVIVQEGVRP